MSRSELSGALEMHLIRTLLSHRCALGPVLRISSSHLWEESYDSIEEAHMVCHWTILGYHHHQKRFSYP